MRSTGTGSWWRFAVVFLLSAIVIAFAFAFIPSHPSRHFIQLFLFLVSRHPLLLCLSWCSLVSLAAFLIRRPLPVFLVDYSCHKPDDDFRSSYEMCEYFGRRTRRHSPESEAFMRLIYSKSGLGDETYAPPFVFHSDDLSAKLHCAVQEAEEGMFGAVQHLLAKTDVHPSQIGLVITACSLFTPAPSFSSMLVRRFGFPEGVKTFSLSGMGCSAGTVAFDLAAKVLRQRKGYGLIVVTESISLNFYFGDNKHMLVTNCIFRVGTAAALVSSDPAARPRSKMELVQSLRTHHGADDAAYNAAIQMEDEDGQVGVALTKDLIRVAGAGLRSHITTLAPSVLPVAEMLRYACRVARLYAVGDQKAVNAHVPDFKTAFEHMCIHAGGKAVIDAVRRLMRLEEEVVEPARMCLHRFGNTSSSFVFYELAYMEAKKRIKKGDRVWMLAFGTGFKACSVVWRALRDSTLDSDNPWALCIHRYPLYPPPTTKKDVSLAPSVSANLFQSQHGGGSIHKN